MLGTVGEDYTTLDTIKRTGGVVPDATWPETWQNIQADADVAQNLGLSLVTFHAGFLPHEASDPAFAKLSGASGRWPIYFAARKMDIALETGQEAPETMPTFLRALDRPNVGVNFDPANMILYDKGDPIAAVARAGPVDPPVPHQGRGPHQDARHVGRGSAARHRAGRLAAVLPGARRREVHGNLCIEREAGKERVGDIRAAREVIEKTAATI